MLSDDLLRLLELLESASRGQRVIGHEESAALAQWVEQMTKRGLRLEKQVAELERHIFGLPALARAEPGEIRLPDDARSADAFIAQMRRLAGPL